MKKLIIAVPALLMLVGCTATQQGAAVGGASGAAIGAAVSGDVEGAAVGGAVGAVAGALIGKASEPGRCVYEDSYGRRYVAECPA